MDSTTLTNNGWGAGSFSSPMTRQVFSMYLYIDTKVISVAPEVESWHERSIWPVYGRVLFPLARCKNLGPRRGTGRATRTARASCVGRDHTPR